MPIKHIIQLYLPVFVVCLSCLSFRSLIDPDKKGFSESPQTGIVTSGKFTVEQLVKEIFIKGGCKNVFNIQPIGNLNGIGYFENGASSIGLEKGIILSTGPIKNAEGPNSDTQKSGDFGDKRGDIDLNSLVQERVMDAVGIEFDFIPLESEVTFKYVFASEEYCEFVGTEFNDIFGFFVSGPGLEGDFSNKSKNVALIPGTEDFVSINSVNFQKNSSYYIGNELRDDATSCNIAYANKPTQQLIEYDGFTVVLESTLQLIPCETYRIRLVVADRSDPYFDSAVFLGANSFTIGGEATITARAASEDLEVDEGCKDGYFLFERVNLDDLSSPITVPFKISAESSAEEGKDFSVIPRTIEIPAGEPSIALPIEVLVDDLAEAPDSLMLELDYPCECRTDTARLILLDPPILLADMPSPDICLGDTIELLPKIYGGNPPYRFEWENGDTSLARKVAPTTNTRYTLNILDNCGQFFQTSTTVNIIEAAQASLSGSQEICKGEKARLNVSFTGEAPWSFAVTFPDKSMRTFDGIRNNPFSFEVEEPGRYQLSAFSDGRCKGIPLGEAEVRWSIVQANAQVTPPSCYEKNDGSIAVNITSGTGPFDFEWSDRSGSIEQTRQLGRGQYTVSITDGNNCTTAFELSVNAPGPLGPVLYDCNNTNIRLRSLRAAGGTPPYLYSVNGVNFSTSFLFEQLDPGSLYTLTIKDANGCLFDQPFQLPTGIRDFVRLQRNIVLGLGDKHRFEPELLVPRTLIDSVSWYPEDNLTCADCLDPILTAVNNDVYKMEVFDIFGCKDTATVEVTLLEGIQVYVPTAFSPNGDGVNDRLLIFAKNTQINQVELFQVYDRWGNLMHERRQFQPGDLSSGWDGRINGKSVNTGTYIYNIILELVDGTKTEMRGSVLLMK